jgi:tetratricopeptide (TPR) repeat protein
MPFDRLACRAVPLPSRGDGYDAERRRGHSHAERGNEFNTTPTCPEGARQISPGATPREPFGLDEIQFLGDDSGHPVGSAIFFLRAGVFPDESSILVTEGRSSLMPAQDGRLVVDTPAQKASARSTRQALGFAAGYLRAGDIARAEQAFNQIADEDPSSAEACFFLGLIHHQRKDLETAAQHYERALNLAPDLAEASNNLGVILQLKGNLDEAEACFREAIRLMPDYAEASNNLGNVLQDQGRFEEAVTAYRQALHFRPRYLEALKHLGNALRALGRLDEAIACYDEGLRLAPEHNLLHTSRAMVRIQLGDLPRGFAEVEWRLRDEHFPTDGLPQPVWDGSRLEGRTLLICAEQGLGDTIQFIRFAGQASRLGARVVVVCSQALARIVATCPGVEGVVTAGSPLPLFSCHAPVMSLPRILGTTLETIPCEVPYLFPEPSLVDHWRGELEDIKEFKVGVVWQGNPVHSRDRERSFRLSQLERVARVPGVRLFSLQKNFGLEQLDEIADRFALTELGSRLHDLVDTAAVMQNLDLVITVDSAPAHLAGAIGVPVWMVLPFVHDWRWMSDRGDTPWYPTMRLFRQRRFGDWEELFARLAHELTIHTRSVGDRWR